MSRPKPNTIIEHVDKTIHKITQVLEADAIWAVFYKGKPFNLRSLHSQLGPAGIKYKKVSFSNPGHAFNLAEKLNSLFNTADFEVVMLSTGTVVTNE